MNRWAVIGRSLLTLGALLCAVSPFVPWFDCLGCTLGSVPRLTLRWLTASERNGWSLSPWLVLVVSGLTVIIALAARARRAAIIGSAYGLGAAIALGVSLLWFESPNTGLARAPFAVGAGPFVGGIGVCCLLVGGSLLFWSSRERVLSGEVSPS